MTDPSGSSISHAAVTASDSERGTSRSSATDAAGRFAIPTLPPGKYELRVEATGFAAKVMENLECHVGENVSLNLQMSIGAVATEIDVSGDVPLIETERSQQANIIERARLQDLPVNRRNYLDLALLVPAVSDTSDMVDGTDFRVAQTPQSGLSFGGGNGRGNAFYIDGVENYVNSGGIRFGISQEAVQEFQINRNSFSAELGWANGGSVNIITRSGTNELHGNLFGFLRHRSIQARNFFDPAKSAFTRSQAGATLGGPIKRDKTFFFASYERLDRHETAFVPIFRDRSVFFNLTPSQQRMFDAFTSSGNLLLVAIAGQAKDYLIPATNPAVLELFDQNSGEFPFSETFPTVSFKLDHWLSDRHSIFFRGNVATVVQENSQSGALVAFNRGWNYKGWDGTVMFSDTLILNPRWVVETRGMFDYNRQALLPRDPFGPEINITGFGFFGRDIFLPSHSYERHYQFLQNWNYHSGDRDLKLGYDINPVRDNVRSETFFSGRFGFGEAVPLSALLAAATGDPHFPDTVAGIMRGAGLSALVPDLNMPISSLQAFSLGLPTFYQQGFGDPNWIGWSKRFSMYGQYTWRPRPRLSLNLGARYDLEVNEAVLGTDGNNFAPRVGFAWTPAANGKTVLRGGYGLYYAPTSAQFANVADALSGEKIDQILVTLLGLPIVTNPQTGQPVTSADIYQGLLAQGVIGNRAIEASDLAQFGLRPAPGLPGRVIFGSEPVVNPYSQQASLEIEHAFGKYAVSAAYNFNRAAHIGRTLGKNLYYTGRLPDGRPTFGQFDPTILQKNIFEYSANSFFHAGILQVTRRLSGHFTLNAHYTWSKAIDESTDFNSDFSPHDQLNARAERALSSFHHAHRIVANALYESPLATGKGKGFRNNFLGGWKIAPIVQYNSWRPFNPLTGVDILNDGYITNKRPHKAGRNIGQGPDFFTIDMRLSRLFRLGSHERRSLEFLAEGFNLLNRTNFRTVNNTVGDVTLESLPNPLRAAAGNPTRPLSYTSAFDPRQFQFGLKINF